MEWPGALTRALGDCVCYPDVGEGGGLFGGRGRGFGGAVGTTSAAAKAVDGNVGGSENDVDGVRVWTFSSDLLDLF